MLDYVDVPPGATLLQSTTPLHRSLRPAPKIVTPLPNPSPPSSPTTTRNRSNSTPGSPSLSVLPQLLLSSALPGGPTITGLSAAPPPTSLSPHSTGSLLSSKDPLSVPILTVNFRRFVSCVGPVFWLQDRIEEIVTWKKGWKVTCSWLSAYGFFCYFPQLLLCLPHIVLIAIILAGTSSIIPDQPPPTEGSIPWQANIQGIQNLMGTFSDVMDFVKPYTFHLRLTPDQVYSSSSSPIPSSDSTTSTSSTTADTSPRSTPSTTSQKRKKPPPSSPYSSDILNFLVLTLPPLAYIVSLPIFPLRLVFFLAGAAPIVGLHPWIVNVFFPAAVFVGERMWNSPFPESVVRVVRRLKSWVTTVTKEKKKEEEEEEDSLVVGKSRYASVQTIFQRVVDDDRLTDACWQSEMREVELWENERYVGPPSESTLEPSLSLSSFTSSLASSPPRTRISGRVRGSWSKANLKNFERGPWTRRRDGWNGSNLEEEEQVNSTLTFCLAPGWAFVSTEDWRKDVVAEWALNECGGGDEDGWVYTNDDWQDPQPLPVRRVSEETDEGGDAGGGPYVTRRRRWVRRIWFDPVRLL